MSYYDYGDGYIEDVMATTKWTIENFCLTCKDPGNCFSSPRFFANSLRWQLRLYPVSKDDDDYAAVSLTLFTNVDVTIKYDVAIVNDDNQKFVSSGEKQVFFHKNCSRVCPRFIKHEDLMHKKHRLLVGGVLTILCEIRVDFETYSDLKTDHVELQTIKRTKMLEDLFDFEQFLINEKFCDVSFIIGEKKVVAHKIVLASKSEVFSRMFERNTIQNQEHVIEITDVDCYTFVEMLRFIYTRTTKDLKDMAKPLFLAANKYGLNDLKNHCADALVKELSKSNAIEYLSLADRYGLQTLRSKALDFVASNVDGLKNITK